MANISFDDLQVGNKYNMSFVAAPVLSSTLTGAELAAITTYSVASMLDGTIASTHAKVVSSVPTIDKSPAVFKYLVFMKDGVRYVVSSAWVVEGSLMRITRRYASFRVAIDSDKDIESIQNMLLKAGYTGLSVTTGNSVE